MKTENSIIRSTKFMEQKIENMEKEVIELEKDIKRTWIRLKKTNLSF